MEAPVLQARVNELERQVQHLQTLVAELQKEKEEIFYKWVKDDYIDLFKLCVSDIDNEPSKEEIEKYWALWQETFNEKWSSSDCHEQMVELMKQLLETHPIQ